MQLFSWIDLKVTSTSFHNPINTFSFFVVLLQKPQVYMIIHWSTAKLIFTHLLPCLFILLSQHLMNQLREKVHVCPKGRPSGFYYGEGELKSRAKEQNVWRGLALWSWKHYTTAPKLKKKPCMDCHSQCERVCLMHLGDMSAMVQIWLATMIWPPDQTCMVGLNKHFNAGLWKIF